MWLKIIQFCCICFVVDKINAGLTSITVYTSYCFVYRLLFTTECPLQNQFDGGVSSCELTLMSATLGFKCSCPLYYLTEFEGACYLDKEAISTFNCLAEKQRYIQNALHCEMFNKYEVILRNCNNTHVNSMRIKTFDNNDLRTTPNLPNLRQLRWQMHGECQSFNDIVKSYRHLEVEESSNENKCELYDFTNVPQVRELHISIYKSISLRSSKYKLKTFILSKMFLRGMRNLELFQVNSFQYFYDEIGLDIHKEMFESLRNLSKIIFENFQIYGLTPDHFKDLTKLKSLHLRGISLEQFDWLRYVV